MPKQRYKLAFSSLGCAELDLPDVVDMAIRHNVPAVELRTLGDRIDLPGYLTEHFQDPQTLAAYLKTAQVEVVGLDASCRLFADDGEGEAELMALAPWAEALGGISIRVFDGGENLDPATIARGVARWQWWQQQRANHGWSSQLMIETHDTLVTGAAVQQFLAAAPEGIAILWDAFHTWSKGGENPLTTWAAIRASVVHIHVKDGVRGGTEGRAFTHTLPGDGEFPMAALKTQLGIDGYGGPLSLEWGRKWHPYLPPLEQALAAASERRWW
ncbi:MAG: TIM barrel protein [Synoicihabitans sp.]